MVKGIKISELSPVPTLDYSSDELLAAGDNGKTMLVCISSIAQGISTVNSLHVELSALRENIIHVENSSTVNMYLDSTARNLSADFTLAVNESLLFPQLPLIFTSSMTATNEMHNKMVVLSSNEDTTVTLLSNLSAGLTINFLRYGIGEVSFIGGNNSEVFAYPDNTHNLIAYQNSTVTAIKGQRNTWNLKGKLGSYKSGYFILEGNYLG